MQKILLPVVSIIGLIILKLSGFKKRLKGFGMLLLVKNKGKHCRFEGGGVIISPMKLFLEDYVFIGDNCFINAKGGISIGSNTHISRNVVIHTVNHNINGEKLPYDRNDILDEVKIGNYVWIGMNVQILQGVKIGDGAVIGMGATITKDVMPGDIVVGYGQRVVGARCKKNESNLLEKGGYLKNE